MNPKERGNLLGKLKACPRCTSWRHTRQSCPGQPVKCSADNINGSKCGKDHSYMVHDSGVAYCNLARSSLSSSTSSSSTKFSDVNIDQKTVYYLQDVPVNNTDILARLFYDKGSNRVLIRDEYAA